MKYIVKKTAILLILIGILVPLSAEDNGISVGIRFFDKTIYYPDSSIKIEISVINNTSEPFRFKLSNTRVYNLDFSVRTMGNRSLDHAEHYKIEKNSNQPIFFREMILLPGEKYAFIVDLQNFITIQDPGIYTVSADFFPELITINHKIASNPLSLSVRPRIGISELRTKIDEETGEVLKATALPPDKVVEYTIRARQRGQWNKFFLYLDLESLLKKDPDRERRYERLSEEDRLAMLETYKNTLMQQRTDQDIILIPEEFSIIKTEYTPERGTVKVIEKFPYPDYTEVKEYTYYLYNIDGVWRIYDYTVLNMGTE